jgi:hypothetical protein
MGRGSEATRKCDVLPPSLLLRVEIRMEMNSGYLYLFITGVYIHRIREEKLSPHVTRTHVRVVGNLS